MVQFDWIISDQSEIRSNILVTYLKLQVVKDPPDLLEAPVDIVQGVIALWMSLQGGGIHASRHAGDSIVHLQGRLPQAHIEEGKIFGV